MNTEQLILDALESEPNGLTLLELVQRIGRSFRQTQKIAHQLAAAGVLASEIGTLNARCVYCLQRHHAALRAQCLAARADMKAAYRQRLRVRQAERARASRARAAAARAEVVARADVEFERPMIHRIIPAHLAKPLRKRGPASVFELGAMA